MPLQDTAGTGSVEPLAGEAFACAAFFASLVPLFFVSLVPLFFGIGIFPVNYRIKWCFDVLFF